MKLLTKNIIQLFYILIYISSLLPYRHIAYPFVHNHMVESKDELTLACHLQFNFSSAHVSRHRSTSTIITIRRRRREETHKIIRDNQFNGIHYRPRYNKSTVTVRAESEEEEEKRIKKKEKKKEKMKKSKRKKSHVTLIRSTIRFEFSSNRR